MTELSNNKPAPLIPGFQLEKKLGSGGFGTTYLAHSTKYAEPCVIKQLSFQRLQDWKSLELFEREAKTLAHLNHPCIPKFLDYITQEHETQQSIFLVQEFIPGQSLSELIKTGKHLDEKEVIEIGLKIAQILVYLQTLHPPLIHRDIKPGNIILGKDKKVYLIDFGAVRDTILNQTRAGSTIVGTFGYMPPEQFQGRAYPATDLYSLGATLVYALSHKEPHELNTQGLKLDFRPHIQCSRAFADILDKMLEPDWQNRYQQASELVQDLEDLLAGKNIIRTRPAKTGLSTQEQNKKTMLILGVSASVGILVLLLTRSLSSPVIHTEMHSNSIQTPEKTAFAELDPNANQKGILTYLGQNIVAFTDAEPHFWFRDETNHKEAQGEARYQNGHYTFSTFSPGAYLAQIYLNANTINPNGYPGDFYIGHEFTIDSDKKTENIALKQVIHLNRPQDNNLTFEGESRFCDGKGFEAPESKVTFSWDSLGSDVTYDYQIKRIRCPYTFINTVHSGNTNTTQFSLNLKSSGSNEFYLLKLNATKNGETIGTLVSHGTPGVSWDYRFRVR